MSVNIGLDIGAASLKLAAVGDPADAPILETIAANSIEFFSGRFPAGTSFAGCPLLFSRYRRIEGNPVQSVTDLRESFYACVPQKHVAGIRVTGCGGRLVGNALGSGVENEFRAIAT